MIIKQQGMLLYELLIVLTLIGMMATFSLPSLFSTYRHSKSNNLKMQLAHALSLTKRKAALMHNTIAFCIGNHHNCFESPNNVGLLFKDTFGDGVLHHKNQLIDAIMLPDYSGELHFRTFPKYRQSLLFHGETWVESDNGTFWFCPNKNKKPIWGITINRFAMIHELQPNNNDDIIDSSGKALPC